MKVMNIKIMKIIGLLLIPIALILLVAFSENKPKDQNQPEKLEFGNAIQADSSYLRIVDSFFYHYEKVGPQAALSYAGRTNQWFDMTKAENIATNLNAYIKLMGKYSGRELLTRKSAGGNFVLCSYLIKYQRQPLRFSFILYKPEKEWMIYNIEYDDNVAKELKAAANIYSLPENLPLKSDD